MGLPDMDDGWEADDDFDPNGGLFGDEDEEPWTDEDEAALEEYEENKRRKIAEANEY